MKPNDLDPIKATALSPRTPAAFPDDQPVTPYARYARIARTGDIWIEQAGPGLTGQRIGKHTVSDISHCAAVIRTNDSRVLLESHFPRGTRPAFVSEVLATAKAGVAIYRWPAMPRTIGARLFNRAALEIMIHPRRYDTAEILRQARNSYRALLGKAALEYSEDDKLMCYELVRHLIKAAGLELPAGGAPADILRVTDLELVAVLRAAR